MTKIYRPTGNRFLDITKQNDMYFIYAFFFENGDHVHIKIGQSTKPYIRLSSIVQGSPFPVTQAVYAHCGSKAIASSFEKGIKSALADRRTRGEWYVFQRSEASEFRIVMAHTFARCTGRQLKWVKIDMEKFGKDQLSGASKRYMPPAA